MSSTTPLSTVWIFLSTPSARRATLLTYTLPDNTGYFYPRPPRGGRHAAGTAAASAADISIHALREEGDQQGRRRTSLSGSFLSTPSARRATVFPLQPVRLTETFLSTPSARRATTGTLPRCPKRSNFYPRPPRGGRPLLSKILPKLSIFLSTPSARRATITGTVIVGAPESISIHALREEGD